MIGDQAVVRLRDVLHGTSTDLRTGAQTALELPTSNVLAFDLADGSRVLARPSGTEPKIKFYFEVREALGPSQTLAEAEAQGQTKLMTLKRAFVAAAGLEKEIPA